MSIHTSSQAVRPLVTAAGTRRPQRTDARYANPQFDAVLAVAVPHEPQALKREEGIHALDRAGVRGDQVGQAARGDGGSVGPELPSDVVDDAVDLAGEP
jgi:hypothetical protein